MQKQKKLRVKNTAPKIKSDFRWIIKITIMTFIISFILSLAVSFEFNNIFLITLVLSSFIFIAYIFDIVGIAVASADEAPFHSMAAQKLRGSETAIQIIRNRDKYVSIANDVVGDICSIITGACTVGLISFIMKIYENANFLFISLLMTALIAAITVGGKALCKNLGINNANTIIYIVALIFSVFTKDRKPERKGKVSVQNNRLG